MVATIVLFFFSVWSTVNERATARVRGLGDRLDRADIKMKPQEIVLTVASVDALVWILFVLGLHPGPAVAVLLVPVIFGGSALLFSIWVDMKLRARLEKFVSQLEVALHLMAGGIRVGLSMRQAMTAVVDELGDPASYEFRRVIGQTTIGISILDAIDDLARRMPNNETLMVARVFRVQSSTGGDLAKILDQLAETIKGRRFVWRKIGTLTSEGRMSAWVLMVYSSRARSLYLHHAGESGTRAALHADRAHRDDDCGGARNRRVLLAQSPVADQSLMVFFLEHAIPLLFAVTVFFLVLSLLPSKSVLTQQLEELAARETLRRAEPSPFDKVLNPGQRAALWRQFAEAGWYTMTPAKFTARIIAGACFGALLSLLIWKYFHLSLTWLLPIFADRHVHRWLFAILQP